MKINTKILIFLFAISVFACKEDAKAPVAIEKKPRVKIPACNADSIYQFVSAQLDFGYRIPGTPEHLACRDWLVSKFESYGADVSLQNFKASFMGQKDVDSYNIIASYNPNHKDRVLLGAHWDSRMVAEKDKDDSKKDSPIEGADDGGSGVAGLLEIARVLGENPIDLGVDIVLFDTEDNGDSQGAATTWCQGSQYWAREKAKDSNKQRFGILLDMIGSKGAKFTKEETSRTHAKHYLDKVWLLGQRMGYSKLFLDKATGPVTDDHLFVNRIAGIPMIDIINWDNNFGSYHHTHDDTIELIDKNTLKSVTQVVLATLYKVSDGSF